MTPTAAHRAGPRRARSAGRGSLLAAAGVAAAAAALAPASFPARASADVFEGISLVSATPGPYGQQAQYAHDPAVSGDGRYVAFDGSYGGRTGVWRRDLQSGAVEAVSVGEPGTPRGSAELPSISEDGQYVSFTTTAPLVPGDRNDSPDVYVRNMAIPEAQPCEEEGQALPCAFELASAVSGAPGQPEQGLAYEDPQEAQFGAIAAGRSALSGDGRKVVFVTTAVSNLVRYPQLEREEEERGEVPKPHTPALQVVVRDLETRQTELVSTAYDAAAAQMVPDSPVSGSEGATRYGGVFSTGGPPRFAAVSAYSEPTPVGASISADGSTVAWMGQDVDQQVPMLAGEAVDPYYAEPLWRRIADGPLAPTTRVTGGSDPLNPACAASGETALPPEPVPGDPCQGPFITERPRFGVWEGGAGDVIPRLSADGYEVAFLANAPLVSEGRAFSGSGHSDLYVADMHPGLTRDQALRQLTELASGDSSDKATTAPIIDLGISPDGSEVAFTTMRTLFPLGSPAYVTAPSAEPGMLELFDADLADDTLTRVTHGFEGGASYHPHGQSTLPGEDPYTHPEDGALSPSFSNDGNTLVFSSTASNLVYGDGNTPAVGEESLYDDGADAFSVKRRQFGPEPVEDYVSSAPAAPALAPAWRLGASAFSRADGSVLLEVSVPAAGRLSASASSWLRLAQPRAGRASRRSRARHARTIVASRTVAQASAGSSAAALLTFVLRLAPRYSSLAASGAGLSSSVNLLFSATGGPVLRESLEVTFHRKAARKARGRKSHAKKSRAKRSKGAAR